MSVKKPKNNLPSTELNKLIILNNKHCQFICSDKPTFNKLKYYLSYKMTGVEYTPAYQNGWSGITYLIDNKGIFNSGLLEKVKKFLTEHNILFQEEDKRLPVKMNEPLDLSERLKSIGMVPRDYQEAIVNACFNKRKGIVRAATGSGKSLAIGLIAAKLNKPIVVYVIGLDLLKQFHDLFSKLFDEPIGFIGNGVCDIHRINIASIWTIGSALKIDKKTIVDEDAEEDASLSEDQNVRIIKMLNETNVHIFDESHIITTGTIGSIYKTIDPEYIYGFSGTPFRDDNTDLLIHSLLGEKIIDVSASELIERGVLPQPIIKFIPIPPLTGCGTNYQSVYKNYIVENEVRHNIIIKQLKELLDKKYIPLLLFKQINHGKILYDKILEQGIKCEVLSGVDSLERRTEVKDMLEKREIDCLLASTIFNIGVDCPCVSALILCGGGKSTVSVTQKIGRSLRAYPGKKVVAIVDLYDQARYLKQHSKTRYELYSLERGFKLIGMKL